MNTKPKVAAATGGSALGAALSVLLVWILNESGVDVPVEAAAAMSVVVTAALTFLSGYVKKD